MMRLRSLFADPPAEETIPDRQLKFVQSSFLVYASIHQTRAFDSIAVEISQLISEMTCENRKIYDMVLAVDLICTPDAIAGGESQQLAGEMLAFIDRQFPTLRDRFLGITDNENKLPLQALLLTGALALEEIDNEHLFVME